MVIAHKKYFMKKKENNNTDTYTESSVKMRQSIKILRILKINWINNLLISVVFNFYISTYYFMTHGLIGTYPH